MSKELSPVKSVFLHIGGEERELRWDAWAWEQFEQVTGKKWFEFLNDVARMFQQGRELALKAAAEAGEEIDADGAVAIDYSTVAHLVPSSREISAVLWAGLLLGANPADEPCLKRSTVAGWIGPENTFDVINAFFFAQREQGPQPESEAPGNAESGEEQAPSPPGSRSGPSASSISDLIQTASGG